MGKSKKTKRPTNFGSISECISTVKRSVYLIARGRQDQTKSQTQWLTIGTGFLAAPHRMLTASHVINDTKNTNPLAQHMDGDMYYLISHDGELAHACILPLVMDKEIFLYPSFDLAILYIGESFYSNGTQTFLDKDEYIRINQNFRTIGTDIAVLGYPLTQLSFDAGDINKPQIGNILLRTDAGVINTRYRTAADIYRYDFTVAFNPGNSGGPIFDWRTGQLVSIVHGYTAIPINIREQIITPELKNNIKFKNIQKSLTSM
jgi:S1-C subfamily serine protease